MIIIYLSPTEREAALPMAPAFGGRIGKPELINSKTAYPVTFSRKVDARFFQKVLPLVTEEYTIECEERAARIQEQRKEMTANG